MGWPIPMFDFYTDFRTCRFTGAFRSQSCVSPTGQIEVSRRSSPGPLRACKTRWTGPLRTGADRRTKWTVTRVTRAWRRTSLLTAYHASGGVQNALISPGIAPLRSLGAGLQAGCRLAFASSRTQPRRTLFTRRRAQARRTLHTHRSRKFRHLCCSSRRDN